ncbi:MAG: M56 family metallopeptidase [Gemmatimonadota bacterium]
MMAWELLGDPRLLLHALGWALVISFVVGLGVGAVLWALLRIAPRRSAWARYALTCSALVLMAGTLVQSWSGVSGAYRGHEATVAHYALHLMEMGSPNPTGELPGGWHAAELDAAIEVMHDHDIVPWLDGRSAIGLGSLLAVLAVGWLVGVVWRLAALGHALLNVRRLRARAHSGVHPRWHQSLHRVRSRMGVHMSPELAISEDIDGPVLVGWLRPAILLPPEPHDQLADTEVDAVLAHELAHVRRGDYLVNVVQMAVEALLFHHPVVYWMGERIRDEREYCSDDAARRAMPGALSSYLRALVTLEALRVEPVPQPAMGVNGRSLLDRIKRLVALEGRPRPRWDVDLVLVVAGLMLVWLPTLGTSALVPPAVSAVMKHELVIPTDFESLAERGFEHVMKGSDR